MVSCVAHHPCSLLYFFPAGSMSILLIENLDVLQHFVQKVLTGLANEKCKAYSLSCPIHIKENGAIEAPSTLMMTNTSNTIKVSPDTIYKSPPITYVSRQRKYAGLIDKIQDKVPIFETADVSQHWDTCVAMSYKSSTTTGVYQFQSIVKTYVGHLIVYTKMADIVKDKREEDACNALCSLALPILPRVMNTGDRCMIRWHGKSLCATIVGRYNIDITDNNPTEEEWWTVICDVDKKKDPILHTHLPQRDILNLEEEPTIREPIHEPIYEPIREPTMELKNCLIKYSEDIDDNYAREMNDATLVITTDGFDCHIQGNRVTLLTKESIDYVKLLVFKEDTILIKVKTNRHAELNKNFLSTRTNELRLVFCHKIIKRSMNDYCDAFENQSFIRSLTHDQKYKRVFPKIQEVKKNAQQIMAFQKVTEAREKCMAAARTVARSRIKAVHVAREVTNAESESRAAVQALVAAQIEYQENIQEPSSKRQKIGYAGLDIHRN